MTIWRVGRTLFFGLWVLPKGISPRWQSEREKRLVSSNFWGLRRRLQNADLTGLLIFPGDAGAEVR